MEQFDYTHFFNYKKVYTKFITLNLVILFLNFNH